MLRELNQLIKRVNYKNYLENKSMDYRIQNETSDKAKEFMDNYQLSLDLGLLNKKLEKLKSTTNNALPNTTLGSEEASTLKLSMDKINSIKETIGLERKTYEAKLKQALNLFKIGEAVKLKECIRKLNAQEEELKGKEKEFELQLKTLNVDYLAEVKALSDNFPNFDPIKDQLPESKYSENSISKFKELRAGEIVKEFLDTLTPEKYEKVLSENENLKGYINVGESI